MTRPFFLQLVIRLLHKEGPGAHKFASKILPAVCHANIQNKKSSMYETSRYSSPVVDAVILVFFQLSRKNSSYGRRRRR